MTTPSPTHGKRGVLLIDDHPLIRRGVAAIVDTQPGLQVIGEASSHQQAMSFLATGKPALAIVDISLDGNNGIDLMKTATEQHPQTVFLAYSMHDEVIYAERALRAGAKGYVMKQHPPETLITAIKTVLSGKIYLSRAISDRLLGKLVGLPGAAKAGTSGLDSLSDRELEVLQLLGKGLTTSAVADKLFLSVKTIESYREHLKQKLNLRNGNELLRYAIEWSLSSEGGAAK